MNTPEKELKHCTACNQMTNHSGEKCLKHTPDTEWESVFNYSVETGLLKRFFKLYEEGRKTGDPQNFVDYFKAEHYLLTEVGKAIFSRDTYWKERDKKLRLHLGVILPMAKGYVHTNDVGRNREMVSNAEDFLAELDNIE